MERIMKNVIITGSTRGIGLAMAREFLKAGCNVTLSGRDFDISESLKTELQEFSEKYFYVSCDVTNTSDIEKLWGKTADRWGKIDIWINNAGRNSPHEFCWEIDTADIDFIIETNIKGMILGSRFAAKNMILQKNGQIWNMEGLGSNEMIIAKTIIYGTTKRALTYFTRGLAKELRGTGVLVGRLSPGMMLTDFITKTSEGERSSVIDDKKFISVFNKLADRPETVASFFIPKILKNRKNDAHIVWLTNIKAMARFIIAVFKKRELL
jgi:short-subunit dehydrogenase